MALEPAKLSDFTVAGALGSGTTARVYEAIHTATGRPVAIKVMEQASSSGEMRERFAREALLLAGVDSRHVSKILGFGFDKGQPFLVLERLKGETLDAKLRRDGPVPPPIAVRWIEQLIAGVRDCHDAKIIHRDIKPSNIFLHHDGFDESVKLIDFGVARLREIAGDTGGLTSTSHLIGSMGYMAPEQFKSAKSVGYPADLYAVGVVIFRTLTGRLPFVSRSIDMIIKMKSETDAPSVSSMGAIHNPMLDWFVHKALLRDPERRFQSAREMLEHWWEVVASLEGRSRGDPAATVAMPPATAGVHAQQLRVPTPMGPPPPLVAARAIAPSPPLGTPALAGSVHVPPAAPSSPSTGAYVAPAARPPTAPPPTLPHQVAAPALGRSIHQTDEPIPSSLDPIPSSDGASERTIPRLRAPVPLPSTLGAAPRPADANAPIPSRTPAMPPVASSAQSSRPESSDRTLREQDAPRTVPSQELWSDSARLGPYEPSIVDSVDSYGDDTTAIAVEAARDERRSDDPFDVPTRNDPNLRKLVERELELQKARKRGG